DQTGVLIGVYGGDDDLATTPRASPGVLLPPPAPRVSELLARKACAPLGIPVIPAHRAVLSVPQDAAKLPAKLHPDNPLARRVLAHSRRSRQACLWATEGGRGVSAK